MTDSNSKTHFQGLQIKSLFKKSDIRDLGRAGWLGACLSVWDSRWYSEPLSLLHSSPLLYIPPSGHDLLWFPYQWVYPAQTALGKPGAVCVCVCSYMVSITIKLGTIWTVRTVQSNSYQSHDWWADRGTWEEGFQPLIMKPKRKVVIIVTFPVNIL